MSDTDKKAINVRWKLPADVHNKIAIHQKIMSKKKKISHEIAAIDLLEKATSHLNDL